MIRKDYCGMCLFELRGITCHGYIAFNGVIRSGIGYAGSSYG